MILKNNGIIIIIVCQGETTSSLVPSLYNVSIFF